FARTFDLSQPVDPERVSAQFRDGLLRIELPKTRARAGRTRGERGEGGRRGRPGVPKRELGEILLEADLINQGQLAEALGLQRTFGERLARRLGRQHILTEKFAGTYLGRQQGGSARDPLTG